MAAAKTLEPGSQFEKFDTDGDGVVTDAEMAAMERMLKIENDDKKEDQIRAMAWFALMGMLLYPAGIIAASYFALDTASQLLADIAPTYFVAISALVAAFFGAQAYTKGK
jgi:hypothetical protein